MTQLDGFSYADNLALLTHNLPQLQVKTSELDNKTAQLGLNIQRCKTKILKLNATTDHLVTLRGEPLDVMKSLSYLHSINNKLGGGADIKIRIQEARATFDQLLA